MTLSMAWETTIEDVQNVLRRMERRDDFHAARDIHRKLNHNAIAIAALNGNEMDEQVDYAYDEIEKQIQENGFQSK